MNKKTIDFIRKANEKHNFKYVYDKVDYISNKKNVIITCLIHGDFIQRPDNHLMGKGCRGCGNNMILTKELFIEKSKLIHGERYDYSLVDIKNSIKKVKIICKIHGVFEQSPVKHYSGAGCQLCGGSLRLNKFEFIDKANKIHNNIYDYSLTDYKNNKTKVEIICNIHGSFFIIPSNHLKGVGCSICSGKYIDKNLFINKANKIHNYKYIYDNVVYVNHKTDIEIICPEHGIFHMSPASHTNNRSPAGCKMCKKTMSNGEILIENFLKINNIEYKKQFKFSDLKHKAELKFDFAVFKNNELYTLIEYNGEQHYNFRGQFGMSLEDFNLSLERDKKKMDYCRDKNINIIIIKYNDNIDTELSKLMTT